jgi:hypothetical protein
MTPLYHAQIASSDDHFQATESTIYGAGLAPSRHHSPAADQSHITLHLSVFCRDSRDNRDSQQRRGFPCPGLVFRHRDNRDKSTLTAFIDQTAKDKQP